MMPRIGILGLAALFATFLSGCSNNGGSLGSLGGGLFGGGKPQIVASDYELPENGAAGTPPPARQITRANSFPGGYLGFETE